MIPSVDQVDVVVAWYNEELDWLLTPISTPYHSSFVLAPYVILYCKGSQDPPEAIKQQVKRIVKLPNVGREGHTYLTHIIENYLNLAPNTVFLQGKISDHAQHVAPLYELVCNSKPYHANCSYISYQDIANPIHHYGVWLERLQKGLLRAAIHHKCTKDWLEQVWNVDVGPCIPVTWSANFAVTNDRIRRIPLAVYQQALSYFDHPDPEEGHYQERTWAYIFLCPDDMFRKKY